MPGHFSATPPRHRRAACRDLSRHLRPAEPMPGGVALDAHRGTAILSTLAALLAVVSPLFAQEGAAAGISAGEKIVRKELVAAAIMLRNGEPRAAVEHLAIGERELAKLKESDSLSAEKIKGLAAELAAAKARALRALGPDPARSRSIEGVRVESIVTGDRRASAIINGRVVKVGDTTAGGYKVMKIERDRVTLNCGEGDVVLAIDGSAGKGVKATPGRKIAGSKLDVQAIVVAEGHKRAIVNGDLVAEGQEIAPGVKVVKIERNAVTFDVRGEKVVKRR